MGAEQERNLNNQPNESTITSDTRTSWADQQDTSATLQLTRAELGEMLATLITDALAEAQLPPEMAERVKVALAGKMQELMAG